MMRTIPLALAAICLSPAAHAQVQDNSKADVMAVVEAFMAGLESKDAAAMSALATEDGYLAVVQELAGEDRAQSMALQDVIISLTSATPTLTEPLGPATVMVEGPVAMVWAPYDLYVEGSHSHCGIDIFTLMRVDGEWKIATITYSHIDEGCPNAR